MTSSPWLWPCGCIHPRIWSPDVSYGSRRSASRIGGRLSHAAKGSDQRGHASNRTQPADLNSAGRPHASIGVCRSRTNADDRLPADPLGRIESGDGIVEGRDCADVRPQSSVPHPLDDLNQLGTIGLDNEVDRQTVGGPRLGRPDDGHQCSSGSNQACGPLLDAAANDVEHQVDAAYVFQPVLAEVDELLCAEVERLLTVGRASGTDDIAA